MFFDDVPREVFYYVIVVVEMCIRDRATRVLFMDGGVIAEENTPDKFFSTPASPRLKDFLSKVL